MWQGILLPESIFSDESLTVFAQPPVCNGRRSCGLPRLVALGIFGALTKLESAANDLPYTTQVALGLFGQCNAQASKVAHYFNAKEIYKEISSSSSSINQSVYFYCHESSKLYMHMEWGMVLRVFVITHIHSR